VEVDSSAMVLPSPLTSRSTPQTPPPHFTPIHLSGDRWSVAEQSARPVHVHPPKEVAHLELLHYRQRSRGGGLGVGLLVGLLQGQL
jgi:hypothetical protein